MIGVNRAGEGTSSGSKRGRREGADRVHGAQLRAGRGLQRVLNGCVLLGKEQRPQGQLETGAHRYSHTSTPHIWDTGTMSRQGQKKTRSCFSEREQERANPIEPLNVIKPSMCVLGV